MLNYLFLYNRLFNSVRVVIAVASAIAPSTQIQSLSILVTFSCLSFSIAGASASAPVVLISTHLPHSRVDDAFFIFTPLNRKKGGGSNMPTEMNTVCFHTQDAVSVDGGAYTFQMPLDRSRDNAIKVALASCEFPMVQWTIEKDWSRLYMNEGIRLNKTNNFLDVVVKNSRDGNETRDRILLPPMSNQIKKITICDSSRIEVECTHSHGIRTGVRGAKLIGSVSGDILLEDVVSESETTFSCKGNNRDAKYVVVVAISSPKLLCSMLTTASNTAGGLNGITMSFEYNGREDKVFAKGIVQDANSIVRILPSPLARMCGISTHPHRFEGNVSTWPCEATQFWDYIEIPQGFYSPCHRPMCIGQPMRFGAEVESAVNKLYFPLPQSGGNTEHLIVFSDPDGRVLTCSIPPGRYSPQTLCSHLESNMTAVGKQFTPSISFTVYFNNRDEFVFTCERTVRGVYRSAEFGLLFNHAASIDGGRLGFDNQPFVGSHTYTSPICYKILHTERDTHRTVCNIVRMSEISSQKRFRLHSVAPPPLVGVVVNSKEKGIMCVNTFVNRKLFAHGYQDGDLVRISWYPTHDIQVNGGDITIKESDATFPDGDCTCVVRSSRVEGKDVESVCALSFEVPPIDCIFDEGRCVQITTSPEPFNIHFGKENSLPGRFIGFDEGAVQWGEDGSINDGEGRNLPPFEAPYVHCLDHPDYVLMTFSESSGANFEHSYGGQQKHIFCKLSLYPLFREERMLPRDTMLMRNNLSRFTLSFWNPDMKTPYRFHGVNFSFSLNFISQIGEN